MKYDKKEIGARFKLARNELGLSQTSLAQKAGMSLQGYQPNEKGQTAPSAAILHTFASLGINPYWLLTGQGSMAIGEALHRKMASIDRKSVEENRETIRLITDYLCEANLDELKQTDIESALISSDIQNTSEFNDFLNIISEPFRSFVLIQVLNPEDETGFLSKSNINDLYNYHPIRRSWVNSNQLEPEHLKAIFPCDDSMSPTINVGDLAIVDERLLGETTGLFVIRIKGKLSIRRLEYRVSDVKISTDNKHYSDESISQDEALKIEKVGKIVRVETYSK